MFIEGQIVKFHHERRIGRGVDAYVVNLCEGIITNVRLEGTAGIDAVCIEWRRFERDNYIYELSELEVNLSDWFTVGELETKCLEA